MFAMRFEHLFILGHLYILNYKVSLPISAHFSISPFVFLLLICRDCGFYCLEFIEVDFETHYLINLSSRSVSIWRKGIIPCSNSI